MNVWPLSRQNSLATLQHRKSLNEDDWKSDVLMILVKMWHKNIGLYPTADDSSSVFPKASKIWSSFGLLSPVKVLEKPIKWRNKSAGAANEVDLCWLWPQELFETLQALKEKRRTFVSSFGVYFGDPVVSFRDVTVVKQMRSYKQQRMQQ